MNAALVSMQDLPPQEGLEFAPSGAAAWQKAEIDQILAIARHMRDAGSFEPCIFCKSGGELAGRAQALGLPHIALKSGIDLGESIRLWRWQHKISSLLLLANGESSLPCARRFLQVRRKKPVFFVPVFLVRPPAASGKALQVLRRSGVIVCGSDNIRTRLTEILESGASKTVTIQWLVHPAGLDLGEFAANSREYDASDFANGKHFVFGMAGSLSQHSGALLVIRAMAAIWQTSGLPPWEVRMIGAGDRYEEILAEALSLGVASRLSILGSQFPGPVAASCHVWLAPGSARMELPDSMGAAAAVGLPLICSSSDLHREWLHYLPQGAALEVLNDNPQELAKFMLMLMREEAERSRLAKASRDCRGFVGVEEMAAKICQGLEQAL